MCTLLRRTLGDVHHYLTIASLVLLGCASEPAPIPPVPMPADAAADGSPGDASLLPEPLPECDQVLPSAAMDTPSGSLSFFEELYAPTRAVGDDVYYRSKRQGGIWVVTVPDTTPRLVVPPLAGVLFQDFWVEEETIYLASYGALYSAPRSGGPATLLPNHAPMDHGGLTPPTGEDWWNWWMYVRAGDFLYFSGRETRPILRRVRWTGGPIEVVGQIPTTRIDPPVVVDGLIYYAAIGTSVEPPVPDSLWSLSIADEALQSSLVKLFEGTRGLSLFGFNAGLYARLDVDRSVGLFPPSFAWGQMPEPVRTDPVELLFGSAMFDGDLYFMGTRWFRAPDGAGFVQRPMLMRVGPGSTQPELVRCISLQRSGTPPKDEQFLFGKPGLLFASSTGVFGTVGPMNVSAPGRTTTYPHVVKFWPQPSSVP